MGYQPWYTTETYPALQIPLNVEGNADNITGLTTSNLTMVMRPASGSDITGTGTFNILTASPAVVTYIFSTADVASAFVGQLIIKATFPNGGIAVYDGIPFTVSAV